MTASAKHGYIRELDGLRAIAVLMVMLFHLRMPGLSLGWAGVPLFFVLSGFLITGILVDAKEKRFGEYVTTFLLRRSLRIFPLYYLYLVVNAALALALGKGLAGYGWYVFYLQNYSIGMGLEGPGVLGHTWSLAVEEQFYLVWPLLVFSLARKGLVVLCGALILGAPIARWWILSTTGSVLMTNTTLPSSLDMLAYGAFLSVLWRNRPSSSIPDLLGAIGGGIVVLSVWRTGIGSFWVPQSWVPGNLVFLTALGWVFGAVIWRTATQRLGGVRRLLSTPVLVQIGRISYGLYIWHLLCFEAGDRMASRVALPPGVSGLAGMVLSFAIASASFRFFEMPFLRMKDRFAPASRPSSTAQSQSPAPATLS